MVEGPVAAGKSKFAKELADDLDMLYVPEANLDLIYINRYGYNMRQLDDQMPESCKSFDVTNFLKNPTSKLSATFQMRMYLLRSDLNNVLGCKCFNRLSIAGIISMWMPWLMSCRPDRVLCSIGHAFPTTCSLKPCSVPSFCQPELSLFTMMCARTPSKS